MNTALIFFFKHTLKILLNVLCASECLRMELKARKTFLVSTALITPIYTKQNPYLGTEVIYCQNKNIMKIFLVRCLFWIKSFAENHNVVS